MTIDEARESLAAAAERALDDHAAFLTDKGATASETAASTARYEAELQEWMAKSLADIQAKVEAWHRYGCGTVH